MNSMLKIFCMMTHALHGQNCFLLDHAPPHTEALARAWRWCTRWLIDKLVTREKKWWLRHLCYGALLPNVHAAIHAQQEVATLQETSSPAVLKMDANKKNDGFYDCGSLPDLLDVAAPRYTHHALRTARLSGTCNKSTTLKVRCGTNVQPNFTIAA